MEPPHASTRPSNWTSDFEELWLRGDTDFSLTEHLDQWDEKVKFVLGYDARLNLVAQAQQIAEAAWQPLQQPARYEVQTEPRKRPDNVKAAYHPGAGV